MKEKHRLTLQEAREQYRSQNQKCEYCEFCGKEVDFKDYGVMLKMKNVIINHVNFIK